MLVLSRHRNEVIIIDPRDIPPDLLTPITITVVDIRGDNVRLGVEAGKEIPVHRQEVYIAILGKGDKMRPSKHKEQPDVPGE